MSIANTETDPRLAFNKSDRLAKALKIADLTSNEMAEHLHVSRTTISNYINGRTEPNYSQMRDWAMHTGVPFKWLKDGVVQPEIGPDGPGVESRLGESNSRPSHYKYDSYTRVTQQTFRSNVLPLRPAATVPELVIPASIAA